MQYILTLLETLRGVIWSMNHDIWYTFQAEDYTILCKMAHYRVDKRDYAFSFKVLFYIN